MANPDPSPETRFKPGQSGNPGGISSEMKALIAENAEKAVRIRAALLAKVSALIDEETGELRGDVTGEILKLVKDSEDRGFGSPKQTLAGDEENPIRFGMIERVIVDPAKATD